MSETLPIGAAASGHQVRAAIARAASRTGVDFDYLLAQAKIESSLDPSARARTSSAAGLYQFTQGTWLRTLERHGAAHGIDWADAAIDKGRVVDPAMRGQIMALRHDPDMAALMAGELANDNRASLTGVLGREPDAAELYLAHFLGAAGAGQFLSALETSPGMSAAALMPRAAAANRSIFYEASGAPRSVAGMMDLIRAKVSRAMEGGEGPAFMPPAPALPETRLAATAPAVPSTPARPSMAETLRTTFAVASPGAALPASVEKAYGRLRSLGL